MLSKFSPRTWRWTVLIVLLALSAGCTQVRVRPRPTQTFKAREIPPTPAPLILPRFTPHVTSIAPTATPTPIPNAPAPAYTPAPPPILPPPTPTPYASYIVQPGETLYDIAEKFHVSLKALARANHITDPTVIKPGDRLIIP